MKKAFKYRFYPTADQETLLRRTVGCCRFVYNRALAMRSEAYTQRKEKLSGYDLQLKMTAWKSQKETAWLKEVSSVPLQQAINNLDVAYQNFFAKRAAFPKFKRKSSGGSCRFTKSGYRIKDGEVWLARTKEPLNVRWSRPLPKGTTPSQCTVRLSPSGEWHISFLCDVKIAKLAAVNKHVGLDMGITALVTTSDGEKVYGAKATKRHARKLAHEQRELARKQKGSRNQWKARIRVARVHRKISDIRKDQLHKLSTRLVRENQSIAIEDLAVRNMLKNHCLAGSISDAGWQQLKGMLAYKCEWYGRELRVIDRWFPSSKTCSKCGHVVDKLPLTVRQWECPKCGSSHDRDVNAAINILAAGTAVSACGGDVRPKRVASSRLSSAKQESPGL